MEDNSRNGSKAFIFPDVKTRKAMGAFERTVY